MGKLFEEKLDRIRDHTGKSDYAIARELEFADQRALLKFVTSKATASKKKLMVWKRYLMDVLGMTSSACDKLIERDADS